MNAKRKILVVLLTLVVFCSFTLINVSASSATNVADGTAFNPVFAPVSISYTDGRYNSLTDIPFTVLYDVNNQQAYDATILYEESTITDYLGEDISHMETILFQPGSVSYNSSLTRNEIMMQYAIRLSYVPDVLSGYILRFNDFFFDTPNISNYSSYLPSLFSLVDGNDNIDSVAVLATVTYYDGDDISKTLVVSSGADVYYCLSALGNSLSQYSYGCFLSDVIMTVAFADTTDYIEFAGEYFAVDYQASVGGAAFANSLSTYLEPVIIDQTTNPTLMESILPSLNAVWNASLFGTFTIGQVFSACAGFALFSWILKIFNR